MKTVFLLFLLAAPNKRFEQAQQSFLHGVEYAEKGQLDQAILAFRTSLSLRDSPAAWYNLGLVCKKASQWECAAEAMHRFLQGTSSSSKGRPEAEQLLSEAATHVGRVHLLWDKEARQVFLNGEPLASEPREQVVWLKAGVYDIRIEWQGYEPTVRRIEIMQGQEVSVELTPQPVMASLHIDVQPEHAQIHVDGVLVATGRYSKDVEPGVYQIEAVSEGYFARQQTVRIGSEGQRLNWVLDPEEESITQKWWFWTAMGVVAAGVVVGTTVAVTGNSALDKGSLNFVGRATRFSW